MKESVTKGELDAFVKRLDNKTGVDGPTDATPYADLSDEQKALLKEVMDDMKVLRGDSGLNN